MGRLLAYDLAILRNGARAAFSRRRDVLLLLLALPVLSLTALEGADDAAKSVRDIALPGKILLVVSSAILIELAVARRLFHLREESVVARLASHPDQRLAYRLFWNVPPLLAWLTVNPGDLLPWPAPAAATVLLVAVYGLGTAAGTLTRQAAESLRFWWARRRAASGSHRLIRLPNGQRRSRIAALVMARTGFAGPSLATNFILFAASGALLAIVYLLLHRVLARPAPALIAGLFALLLLGLLLRQHPPLLRYLLYLGVAPAQPALVPVIAAVALGAGFVLACLAWNAPEALASAGVAAAAILLFASAALLRAFHYATRPRQPAEFAMQIDIALVLLAGSIALPLAPAFLVARLVMLHRRARALRFVAP